MTTAPAATTLLTIVAGGCTYLVAPHGVDWMRAYDPAHPPTHDARGMAVSTVDLAALLRRPAHIGAGHLLGVYQRRRSVALIVERVDALIEVNVQPLAPFFARRLTHPWVQGAALLHEQPVIMLDLRGLALDALAAKRQ